VTFAHHLVTLRVSHQAVSKKKDIVQEASRSNGTWQ
jgi:hypothetical protein